MKDKPADKATALWVVETLRQEGHEAYFAGGCVRDMLLGRPCNDYDVATSATPDEVAAVFRRVLLVGAKFGVAIVMRGERQVEVATFRSDVSYSDGRRPDAVRFASPREDALRRDFTINGMFYDPIEDRVIDYVDGRADLEARIVRTIGPADDRFGEDYLRLIRAIRFATTLDFALDEQTSRAIVRKADRIGDISGERICEEMRKMLSHPSAGRAMRALAEHGLAQQVLPEFFEEPEVWQRALRRVDALAGRDDARGLLAALLLDLSAETVGQILRRWGCSNEWREEIQWLARHRDDWESAPGQPLCEFKRLMARPGWPRLLRFWRLREEMQTGRSDQTDRAGTRAAGIAPEEVAPSPLVDGEDLKALGMPEGPALGKVLRELYDRQLNGEFADRDTALQEARKILVDS